MNDFWFWLCYDPLLLAFEVAVLFAACALAVAARRFWAEDRDEVQP